MPILDLIFKTNPIQKSERKRSWLNKAQKALVDREISEMLKKGAIRVCRDQSGQRWGGLALKTSEIKLQTFGLELTLLPSISA